MNYSEDRHLIPYQIRDSRSFGKFELQSRSSLPDSGAVLQPRDDRQPERAADERGARLCRLHGVHEARPGLQG